MGILADWWAGIEKRRREKYVEAMDRMSAHVFEMYKDIRLHTCECGSCSSSYTIEWHRYSDKELEYMNAWAIQQFTWDSDDVLLLDFADECDRQIPDPNRWRKRMVLTRIKARRF